MTAPLHRSKFRKELVAGLIAAAFSTATLAAHGSTNLVADSGFESAGANGIYGVGQSLDGAWSVTKGQVYIDSGDPYVYDGNNSLNLAYINPYTANTVSQTLATIAGQTYTLSFFGNADTPNTFSATENGLTIAGEPASIGISGFAGVVTNSGLFTNYLGTFTATSGSTLLALTATGNPPLGSSVGSVIVDDVSVTSATAVTPEPGSFALVLTGLAGASQMIRRRLAKA